MKLPFLPILKWSALVAVSALFVGCQAESTMAVQELTPVKPAVTNVLTNAANAPALQVASEPIPEPPAPSIPKISAQLQDIVTLAERGVGDDVLLAFVAKAPAPMNLTAEEILYLNDLGISEAVITVMIRHRGTAEALATTPVVPPTNPATAAAAPPPPAPPIVANPAPSNAPAVAAPAPSVTIMAAPEFETVALPPAALTVAPPPVQESYFYSSLQPYGSWVQVADYGYCWQPTVAVVNPDWRPYCDRGRWIYSDCGWYWHSDYSWGWAPFHYGRWQRHPHHGWVWLPDTVWGPAWVTWRYSDSYYGWAPLPPGAYFDQHVGLSFRTGHVGISFDFGLGRDSYTFVPSHRFYDRTPWRHALPRNRVAAVYNNTTVINNYVQINKNVVNEGIGRDRIARITQSEIKKVPIRDTSREPREPGRNVTVKPDRLERNGSELVVYRPQIPRPVNAAANPREQQELRKPATSPPTGRVAGSFDAGSRSVPSVPMNPRFSGRTEPSTSPTGPASIADRSTAGAGVSTPPSAPARRSFTDGSGTARPGVPPLFKSPAETVASPIPESQPPRPVNDAPERRGSSPQVPKYSIATPSPVTPASSTAPASAASVGAAQSPPATGSRFIPTPVRPSPYRELPRPVDPTPGAARSAVEASPASPPTVIPSNPRPIPGTGRQPYDAGVPIPESRRELPKPAITTPIERPISGPAISGASPQPYPGSGRQPMAGPSGGNPPQQFSAPGRYTPPSPPSVSPAPAPAPATRFQSAPNSVPAQQLAPSGARPSASAPAPAAGPPASRSGGSNRRNEIEK